MRMTSGIVFGTGGKRLKLLTFSLLIKICWLHMQKNVSCGVSGRLNRRRRGRRGRERRGRMKSKVVY